MRGSTNSIRYQGVRQRELETLESRIAMHGGAVDEFDVLVFSRTEGFRHSAIPKGVETIQQIGFANGFHTEATESADVFTDDGLADYEVVVFLNTTGDVLNPDQQAAFERFIQSGRGYVGVHSAADTEYDWPWYGDLVGAYFRSHPAIQSGTVRFEDRVHPATADLPERWTIEDEWYDYRVNPRGDVHVLATLDEDSYEGGRMGFDHPIAWAHDFDGGRAFYTGFGHVSAVYDTPEMQSHLLGGILYAAGEVGADVGGTIEGNYRKVVLDDQTSDPMQMDIAADGRVFYVQRGGAVRMYDPATDSSRDVGNIAINRGGEDGLLGIALDPQFDQNRFIYLFYSAATADENRVSRFTLVNEKLDADSESILLRIPSQHQCCHSGGALEFGPEGLLYVGTGDATNPFESSGFAPIDERPNRQRFDAQRSSGNTDDLRGKILRIRPEADGSYSIPEGNLFPSDGSGGRPEIYVMGNRNPFRLSIDSETGWLYWGEVGPDARNSETDRGPLGHDEFNQAREAGNYGWPYFTADNQAYVDFDFASGESFEAFDPAAPVNDSPNNTGASTLPPAQPAMLWYTYGASEEFPELGQGGRTAMAGPVYHFDSSLDSSVKLPEYFDKTLFIYEWSRNWIQEVKLDQDGEVLAINPVFSDFRFRRPMDMEIGPDGAVYVIEWGSDFRGGNADSLISRLEYVGGPSNQLRARIDASADNGSAPLGVRLSATPSTTADGQALQYAWDFESDGVIDSTTEEAFHTFLTPGVYTASLSVTDASGQTDRTTTQIVVGNTRPVVEIVSPFDGQFFDWGQQIDYEVRVDDGEDGSTDDGELSSDAFQLQPLLGHDSHGHPLDVYDDFKGSFVAPSGDHGDAGANLYLAVEARFEDAGVGDVPVLTGQDLHILQPRTKQAEHFDGSRGVEVSDDGTRLTNLDEGDYFSFTPVFLGDITDVELGLLNPGAGATVELRLGSIDGPLLASHQLAQTLEGSVAARIPVPRQPSTHELLFVLHGTDDQLNELEVDWVRFESNSPSIRAGDLNGDGTIGFEDFLRLSANFGQAGTLHADGDFDGNGVVDFSDFLIFSSEFDG